MRNYGYNEDAIVNIRDSVLGVVKRQNWFGLYIDLNIEADEEKKKVRAFGYWNGRVPVGTKVICSVRKQPDKKKDMLVRIDSVLYEAGTAA